MPDIVLKRTFDLFAAIFLLTLLAPLLIAVAILVKIFLGDPVLFRQIRPGLRGRPFVFYKFRTMDNRHDAQGLLLPDAERITHFGRFLRSWSLDELLQLFNVIKGDMSLVGPRPLLMEYLPLYSPEQARRHEVKPGITGWAQVNGRNTLSWEDRFQLDVWYVEHRSFLLDLRILFLTFWRVLQAYGINQPGQATMKRFTGNRNV